MENKCCAANNEIMLLVKDAVRASCAGQQPAAAMGAAPAKGGCCG